MSPNKGTVNAKPWFLAKKHTLLHIDNQLFPEKHDTSKKCECNMVKFIPPEPP